MTRPALNDKQIARMAWRIGLFQRRGLDEGSAERLADRCADRDWKGSDLRACIECLELVRGERGGRACDAARRGVMKSASTRYEPAQITRFIRCPWFKWQTP